MGEWFVRNRSGKQNPCGLNPYTNILDTLLSIRQKNKQPEAVRKGLHISLVRNKRTFGAVLVDPPLMLKEEIFQFLFPFIRISLK